jgi:cytochrome c biogenesis factor
MVLTAEIEIAAFAGAVVGCLVGTLAPYYNEKKRLGWDDITIFFDKKFLKSTIVALILAVVGVGGSFPTIMANVTPTASILTTLITSGVLAMAMNLGGNMVVGPSKVTQDAKSLLAEKKAVSIVTGVLESKIDSEEQLMSTRKTLVENEARETGEKAP